MKFSFNIRNIPDIDFDYNPRHKKLRLDEIEEVEQLLTSYIDKYLYDNFEKLAFQNGIKLDYDEFLSLRQALLIKSFINWVNNRFNAGLNPEIIEFVMNAVSETN